MITTPGPLGPQPPLDPELGAALAALPEFASGEMTAEKLPGHRRLIGEFSEISDDLLKRDGAYEVSARLIPGPRDAPDIEVLICLPAAGGGPVPAIYHIHGGGMVLGDNRTGINEMLELAAPHQAAVVSVEYRLAPETRHPGPVEDCYAGLVWPARNASELGLDPERIVVAGGSAGGGLAAATALLARDRGGPALAGQLLMCPMLDDRNDTPSAQQMEGLGVWDRWVNDMAWTALLGRARGGPDVPPYAAPARADDLSGLPPAYIDVGSAETFRAEAVTYASRIWQAGGDAELHVWPGGFHSFPGFVPEAALSRDAVASARAWLTRLLNRQRPAAG
jgi:acetyl esterase/lipase